MFPMTFYGNPLTFSLTLPTGKKKSIYTQEISNSHEKTAMKLTEHIHGPQRMSPLHFGHSMAFLLYHPKGKMSAKKKRRGRESKLQNVIIKEENCSKAYK